jgi:ATP synthase protein I
MAVALLTYVTKIGLLGLLLVLLMDATWLSGEAFAAGALVSVAVWLPLEIRSYSRARLFVLEPPPAAAAPRPDDRPRR